MSQQPTDDQELFALAARLAGVQTIDLLKVRQEGDSLVVILITGQKFRFDLGALADVAGARAHDIAAAIQSEISQLTAGAEHSSARN